MRSIDEIINVEQEQNRSKNGSLGDSTSKSYIIRSDIVDSYSLLAIIQIRSVVAYCVVKHKLS